MSLQLGLEFQGLDDVVVEIADNTWPIAASPLPDLIAQIAPIRQFAGDRSPGQTGANEEPATASSEGR
jgi:hypothetical protein